MDYIIARMPNDYYGFISTDNSRIHGFTLSFKDLIKAMERKDKDFTYASPMELPLMEHQRAWKRSDGAYLNKLKHYHDEEAIEFTMLMAKLQREGR